MSRSIIEVKGLSKSYRLGQIGATTLREDLNRLWGRLKSTRNRGSGSLEPSMGKSLFWALKDVTFSVQKGEVLGIIGKNGAGKSTLLKILSRITEPTAGEAHIRGRLASLLEVGTGFHPDLNGRENIFLNGALMGLTKSEVHSKFDEIVAFSEIGKFIDTPVKRYSSGMYVRLAFAVAAHLDPEILIVDEVLAVGDVAFQKKCLGKMNEVSSQRGRTVLFVSHNMNSVENICDQCLYMENGQVKELSSDVEGVIGHYLTDSVGGEVSARWENKDREFENPWFTPLRMSLCDKNDQPLTMPVRNDSEIWVRIEGRVEKPDDHLQIGYGISHTSGPMLYWSTNCDGPENEWTEMTPGNWVLCSRIPPRFLNEGEYRIDLFLNLYHREWICEPGVMGPSIYLDIKGGLSDSPYWVEQRPGLLAPAMSWEVSTL